MRRTLIEYILVICGLIHGREIFAEGPVIRKLAPAEAAVGQTVKILGENLEKTLSVSFLVGKTVKSAEFQVISNRELSVLVPEFLTDKTEAVVIVQTEEGLAATCPLGEFVVREERTFLEFENQSLPVMHVIRGGVATVTLPMTIIEEQGVLYESGKAAVILIKNGGSLGEITSDSAATIIYEPEATIGNSDGSNSRASVHRVQRINLAEGLGFLIRTAPAKARQDNARKEPTILSLDPPKASPGEIVTIDGTGLTGTKRVLLVAGEAHDLAFQVVSDSQLKIAIPDDAQPRVGDLIVVNDRGLTATHSRKSAAHRNERMKAEPRRHNAVLFPGTPIDAAQNPQDVSEELYIVEKGIVFQDPAAVGVFLVKRGGMIINAAGLLFYEPGATVPPNLQASKLTLRLHNDNEPIQVPHITVNQQAAGLEITPKKVWKLR